MKSEFASIADARAYVGSLRAQLGSFSAQELADTLTRLDSVYRELPELEPDYPLQEWIETIQTAATTRPDDEAIPLLMYCVALDPSRSRTTLLLEKIALSAEWRLLPEIIRALPLDELPRDSVALIIQTLQRLERQGVVACLISALSDHVDWEALKSASGLEDVFSWLLGDLRLLGAEPDVMQIVRSTRRRLQPISEARVKAASREKLLRLAEHLHTASPRSSPRTHMSAANTKTSFTEYLRQWPCEIELSPEADDTEFIEEAYRTILLREPGIGERDRDLDLLRNGDMSRPQILQHLLASGEFNALGRHLRLIWRDQVLLAPQRSADLEIPMMAWPRGLVPSAPGQHASQAPEQSGISTDDGNSLVSSSSSNDPKQRSVLVPLEPVPRPPNGAANKERLPATATRQARLEHFNSHIYGAVEGWLGDRMWQIIDVIGVILDQNEVRGHIAEFGVHHGLFFFLLNALRNDTEECFAIDIFDYQSGNRDRSGQGSLAMLLSHIETLMPSHRPFLRVVQRDTTSFSPAEIRELFGKTGVKFFSVDAGHTAQHTLNDLRLAQEVLVPYGVVALDDYMSVHWPGVTEGFYQFIDTANRRLKPFAYFQNKLFMTRASEHASWLEQFRAALHAKYRDEVRAAHWKEVEIAGSKCLSFS